MLRTRAPSRNRDTKTLEILTASDACLKHYFQALMMLLRLSLGCNQNPSGNVGTNPQESNQPAWGFFTLSPWARVIPAAPAWRAKNHPYTLKSRNTATKSPSCA